MSQEPMDRLRQANPIAHEPAPPPVELLLDRLQEANTTPRRARSSRLVLAVVGAGTAVVAIVIALLGRPGDDEFNVAAAVYRATTPRPGVLHVVTESTKIDLSTGRTNHLGRVESWYDAELNKERSVQRKGSRVRENTLHGRTLQTWTSTRPDIIRRSVVARVVDRPNDFVSELRAAYRAGRVKVVGHTRIGGREAWRLAVKVPGRVPERFGGHRPPSTIFVVDAKTFLPIQVIGYASAVYKEGGPFVPIARNVTRYLTYERLAPTDTNRGLLNMARHPGAQIRAEKTRREG